MSRLWVTESAFSDGWDSEAILLTEAAFKAASSSDTVVGKVHRNGTLTSYSFVYGVKTGSVFASTAIEGAATLTCTIYDPITRETIATPTVSILHGGVDGEFLFGFLATDTPDPGQWAFEVIFSYSGVVVPFCKGWIDILPAVPT